MTATLIGHFEPGSPEWHAARATGLGGSEVAPVLGLCIALTVTRSGLDALARINDRTRRALACEAALVGSRQQGA